MSLNTKRVQKPFSVKNAQTFRKLWSLKLHIKKYHAIKDIICTSCGEKCADSKALKSHSREYHYIYKKRKVDLNKCKQIKSTNDPCICTLCGFKIENNIDNKQILRYHIKSNHKDLSSSLACKFCGKLFPTHQQHNNHEVLHSDPTIPCQHCNQLFHSQKYLRTHILTHHVAKSELPHQCETCHKGFISSSLLKGHINSHSGLKPFKCRYCTNNYQNTSNRMSHEKKSHQDLYTGIKQPGVGVRVEEMDLLLADHVQVLKSGE